MDEKLYTLCDWGEIEGIVYSEHDNPHNILGTHKTEEGILIHAFIPTAAEMTVKASDTGNEYKMDRVDEAGVYAVLIPEKKLFSYTYLVTYDNGTREEINDPYSFDPIIDALDQKKFSSGIHYTIYDKLGSHVINVNGIDGVLFAVWAPNAIRVSVVGDFNIWDGRRHQMRRLGDSGIFELFIPGLQAGEMYKYEIKVKGGLVMLKADPYANYSERRPNTASIVYDISKYEWTDKKWLKNRKKLDMDKEPMVIYEVHLGSFKKPEDREFYNYRELAPMLADYVLEMGYTHIELLPIMEHPYDASWGYQVTGYYATTSRYGTPDDFMYFVDYMHNKNIGVILDWVPAHFPRDAFGLASFDGTCLYEHLDPRQGEHPQWGTLIYNYGRPQVANFLIANAVFWIDQYHIDAIRMDAVASMLYLDYGKNDGEWVANIYGGNENLEAIAMLKQLSTVLKDREDGNILIAEESTAWPKITGDVDDGGLGFDYKWNMGWMNDFTNYMKCDPLFRKGHHHELTFSMIYNYSEKFILVLSHDEVVHEKGSMINKMPGNIEQKFANLRIAYGFMMTHPGKKLLFMGQDIAQFDEWNENKSIDWQLLEYDRNSKMQHYVKSLFKLYKEHKALYQLDFTYEGFEWINNMDADRSIISFLRKTEKETLLVVCNFTPVVYKNYIVGVPFTGKYKEIFNSDREEFGGEGNTNQRLKQSKKFECDERTDSISITVPPLGISIFTCTPVSDKNTSKKKSESNSKKKNEKKPLDYMISSDNVFANSLKDQELEKTEVDQVETLDKEIAEIKKTTTKKATTKKTTTKKASTKKASSEKESTEKAEKASTKKASTEKASTKKASTEKPSTKKASTEKASTKKASTEKEITEKEITEKVIAEKASTKKASTEKASSEKESTEKVIAEKASTKKASTKKASSEKESTEKVIAEKASTKKASTKKASTKKASTEKASTEKASTEKAKTKKENSEKPDTKKLDTEKHDTKIASIDQTEKESKEKANEKLENQLESMIEEVATTREDSSGEIHIISE